MAKIYYNRIKAGTFKLEDVPPTWQAAVAAMLEADGE